jgi:hypothetical protein
MNFLNSPYLFFVLSFAILWLSIHIGRALRNRVPSLKEEDRDDLGLVLNASLTLLALLIGFSFSMAVSRYDLRKNYEEAEANAIGTEYARTDLLPPDDAPKVRRLLKNYLDQRLLFYTTTDPNRVTKINADTSQLQNQLWSAVQPGAKVQPSAVAALTVAGMNDVLNSQGYTQAAWWNRIPAEAWILMVAIAVGCSMLVGFHARGRRFFLVVPLVVSLAFCLIADIDSPRGGAIRVRPQNLLSLSSSLAP